MGTQVKAQALTSFLLLNLNSTYLQVTDETLIHVSTSCQSVLQQKITALDHPQFPQTGQEYCHLVSTTNGVRGTCRNSDIRIKVSVQAFTLDSLALTVPEMACHSSFCTCLSHKVLCNCKSQGNRQLEKYWLASIAQCFVRSPMPHPSPAL